MMQGGVVAAYSPPHDVTQMFHQQTSTCQRSLSPTRRAYHAAGPGAVVSPHQQHQPHYVQQQSYAQSPYQNWRNRPAVATPPHGPIVTSPRQALTPPHPGGVLVLGSPAPHSPMQGVLPAPSNVYPLQPVDPNKPIFNETNDGYGSSTQGGVSQLGDVHTPMDRASEASNPNHEKVVLYKAPDEPLGFEMEGMHVADLRSGSPASRHRGSLLGKRLVKMEGEDVDSPQDIARVSPTLSKRTKVTLTLDKDNISPHLSKRNSSPGEPRPQPTYDNYSGLDPNEHIVAPTELLGSPMIFGEIDDKVDPRNNIRFAKTDEKFHKMFPMFRGAIVYICDEVQKINRKGKPNTRAVLVMDNVIYITGISGTPLKRSIPLCDIKTLRLGSKGFVGMTLRSEGHDGGRPQHDLLLQMSSDSKAEYFAEVIQALVRWRSSKETMANPNLTIDTEDMNLQYKEFQLTPSKMWDYGQQKTYPHSERKKVLDTARAKRKQQLSQRASARR